MRKKNPELYQAIKTYVERHYEKEGRSPTVLEFESVNLLFSQLTESILMKIVCRFRLKSLSWLQK